MNLCECFIIMYKILHLLKILKYFLSICLKFNDESRPIESVKRLLSNVKLMKLPQKHSHSKSYVHISSIFAMF